jgi:hypothetical protein
MRNHPSYNLSLKGVFFGSLEHNKEEMDTQTTTNRWGNGRLADDPNLTRASHAVHCGTVSLKCR